MISLKKTRGRQFECICLRQLADIIYLKFQPIGEGNIFELADGVPSIGFENNISAAKNPSKLSLFSRTSQRI